MFKINAEILKPFNTVYKINTLILKGLNLVLFYIEIRRKKLLKNVPFLNNFNDSNNFKNAVLFCREMRRKKWLKKLSTTAPKKKMEFLKVFE